MKAWPARAAPWLAAALGVAVTLTAFYPGYLSFDSADQWQQARHFAFTSLHPPLQAMLWHFVDRVWPGPGGMFVLQVLLYWSALALLVAQRRWRAPWQALGVLLLGFWPPLFGLLPHLWKDVPMGALLVLAAALASRDLRHPSEWTRAGVLGCLILACTLRHNAMLAVLPFAGWLLWRQDERGQWRQPRWRLAALTLVLTLGVQVLASLPERHPAVTRTDSVWSVVALWDMAAVSLREQRLIIPPGFVRGDFDLAQMQARFLPYSNTALYRDDAFRHSLFVPYRDDQRRALMQAWLRLPLEHPHAYFAHRLRLSALLFGFDQAALPDRLVLVPDVVALGDNPPVRANASALHQWLQQSLDALVDTPWFAGWLYLLASLPMALLAWHLRQQRDAQLAAVIMASALLYTLPLAVLAGSAEFRYLGWLVQATLLAACLLADKSTTNAETT